MLFFISEQRKKFFELCLIHEFCVIKCVKALKFKKKITILISTVNVITRN